MKLTPRRVAQICFLALAYFIAPGSTPSSQAAEPGLVSSGFVVERPPFASSHASTIVETRTGLIAAWFGGTDEGNLDVSIYLAFHDGKKWSAPMEIANGADDKKRVRHPCWNPVLFQPKNGPLMLFYKVGPSPSTWWGMMMTSDDNGRTWTHEERLPDNIIGPVRSKPVELLDGTILCGSSTENAGWRVHMETATGFGEKWTRTGALNTAMEYGAIQPTIIPWTKERIQIICRSKLGGLTESWSNDGGKSWSRMRKTGLPNPNAGADAVLMRDQRALLVYNHLESGRNMLNVAISEDGVNWSAALTLENSPGEYSYPAVIQTGDGLIHVTYTWKREKIKHAVLDPDLFKLRPITGGVWPKN